MAALLQRFTGARCLEIDAQLPAQLRERLRAFGTQVPSPSEGEVAWTILHGQSTRTIAALPGNAEGTVKAYAAELGITSQAELFSLATRFIAEDGCPNTLNSNFCAF